MRMLSFPVLFSGFFHAVVTFAQPFPDHGTLTRVLNGGVLNVMINNTASDINLIGSTVITDLASLVYDLQSNTSTAKVIIFESGNPDFFIAHYDVLPRPEDIFPPTNPNSTVFLESLFFNVSHLPIPSIAMISGVARGAGNEFLLACDMRFASKPSTLLGQLEVPLGLAPGAGGLQYLPRLIGYGHAFEYILSGMDVDAETAEPYGWVNKAFDTSDEMHSYVNTLATRIALFPAAGTAAAKQSINLFARPSLQALLADGEQFVKLESQPATLALVGKFLELTKNETATPLERKFGEKYLELYQ